MVEPLQKASEEVKQLTLKKQKHDQIMNQLNETQSAIMEYDGNLKDIEWQYEVRLQQFQYLQREKKELFDEFHQKTGIRNLVLEKKVETIQESLETKDA